MPHIPYGGTIDQGVIISVAQDGARVASYSKPGVVTKPLKATFIQLCRADGNGNREVLCRGMKKARPGGGQKESF